MPFYDFFTVPSCQYGNQTYGISQSIITANCKQMCRCKLTNSTPLSTCKPLCQDGEDPKCDPYTQTIEKYHAPVNGTNCLCTKRKCVPGMCDTIYNFYNFH